MKQTLNKQDINILFKEGKWIGTSNIKAIYKPSTEFKYMVSAPIKKFKKATDRNKIKRLLRNSLQGFSKIIQIAIIYNSTKIEDYSLINKEIKEILAKIR
jgi:ribonuclease P protein component